MRTPTGDPLTVEFWESSLERALFGEYDGMLENTGIEEFALILADGSSDPVAARLLRQRALEAIVQRAILAPSTHPEYCKRFFDLCKAFRPCGGIDRAMEFLKVYRAQSPKVRVGRAQDLDLKLLALEVLEQYLPVPSEHVAYSAYIFLLRELKTDDRYAAHALRRLIELDTTPLEDVDLSSLSMRVLSELFRYYLHVRAATAIGHFYRTLPRQRFDELLRKAGAVAEYTGQQLSTTVTKELDVIPEIHFENSTIQVEISQETLAWSFQRSENALRAYFDDISTRKVNPKRDH